MLTDSYSGNNLAEAADEFVKDINVNNDELGLTRNNTESLPELLHHTMKTRSQTRCNSSTSLTMPTNINAAKADPDLNKALLEEMIALNRNHT